MPSNVPVSHATDVQSEPYRNRRFVLFLLIVVYTLNFLDRQILSILKEPIAAELHLSDSDLGLLGGFAFALFYSVLALPAAWVADRFSRVWMMTGALALWSGFTALCGTAANFSTLFLARMGVGVGEAGGVAPAYSLIADYFPPRAHARALAVYSFGIPIGAAAGILFGGLMAKAVNWRFAFVAIGLVGIVLAPVLRALVADPVRSKAVATTAPGLLEVAKLAASKPTFWLLAFGAGCSSLVGYGFLYWLPTFLARSLGMDIVARSEFLATIVLVAGVAGMALGGWLGDKLGQRSRRAYALIPAAAFLVSAPLYALGILAQTPQETFWLFLLPQALGLMWLGPVLNAVQHLSPAASRSTMSALFLLINNLIGLGIGPYFFGRMSDVLRPLHGAESIKYAFIYGLVFYLLATLLLSLASLRIERDWVEETP
ncbi:MAG: MFS transporter [Gammaproteobacteria bacterium]|nr:MAG: MFS transporter [Gammaproteobacteria bacterium]